MRVEPRALVRTLTPHATRLLEEAVARAGNARCYEILPEHLLVGMLAEEGGDADLIVRHLGLDRQRLLSRLERGLQSLRTGNAGRPVFAQALFQWFEDAWVVASLNRGAQRLRTGELLVQYLGRQGRYSAENIPELDGVSTEALDKELASVLVTSPETVEVSKEGFGGGASGGVAGASAEGGALKKYAVNFTEKAQSGKMDPIFGRHREVRQMIDILARRRKNNPILVGEPGVGKTALVEGLALAIAQGEVPEVLKGVQLCGLAMGLLQAGASVKGEFENRLKAVISEVQASAKPIILFIDEAHTLIGAGGQAGQNDAANLLKPALARGELRTVAATTWSEYKKYFEKDPALERRFQPVKVDEPSEADAILMLRGLRGVYEKAHGVHVQDDAVVAAVKLSARYLSGRQLPDKAVDLLDTAAARVKIELAARPEALSAIESQLAALERERDAIARDEAHGGEPAPERTKELAAALAAKRDELQTLQTRWESERAAVLALKAAREAFTSAKENEKAALKAKLDEAISQVAKVRGEEALVHADVDADVVAQVIASWTGIPAGKMRTEALAAALNLEAKLSERVRGQPTAIRTVAEVVRIAYGGIRNPDTPVGVLLFVGPSGVGKTETALALADALYGGERFMTTVNMSEFQEKHSVSRLIGSPPGYVGYGEGGMLTEAVRQRPYSVVLLDEVEKADLEVMNLFYQVFDKGQLNDGEGRTVDFRNTVIILTSNLASELTMQAFANGKTPSSEEVLEAIRPTLSRHFKPALLARMTIVPFAPIQPEALQEIVKMRLDGLAKRLKASHGVVASFSDALVTELVKRCTEAETGARNVDHVLRGSLMPVLARTLLEKLSAGVPPPKLQVDLDAAGAWRIEFPKA
jgi:type VI secretion system protein VasG